MDPRWKWSYFTKYWSARPDWIQKARTAVLNLWKNEYLARAINLNLDLDSSSATAFMIEADPGMGVRPRNGLAVYYNDFDLPTALDEYELYIAEARVSPDCLPVDKDPLSWWLDPVQQKHFPTLQKMALYLLSIPAMSADTERLFSLAKLTNTQIRNRMQDSTLQLLMCLRSWNRSPLLEHLGAVPADEGVEREAEEGVEGAEEGVEEEEERGEDERGAEDMIIVDGTQVSNPV